MAKLSRTKIAAYFAGEIIARKPDVVPRLTALLMEHGRTRELDLIVADIEYALSQRGIIIADVTSARPLDEGTEEAVRKLVTGHRKTDTGDKVLIRETIDESVLGGVRVRARGREVDMTVRHRLNKLRAAKI